MKSQILLLALTAAALSSCTTAYKTGQTPDDVYFSPARPQDEYVQTERRDDRRYQSREEYYDDRYLRMRMRNRMQWSELDDWYYYGSRYDYSYYNSGSYWSNPWSPCSYWNNHYNPYYTGYVIVKPQSTVYSRPRTFNLNTYNNNNLLTSNSYSNPKQPAGTVKPTGGYSNSNYNNSSRGSNSNSGNFLRNIFNGNNNSSNSSNSSGNTRTSTNSSSSSSGSSSSGSSGSTAPVRRF